jgi:beta-glucosidase
MRRIVAAVLLLAASVVDTGAASAADPIYLDPSQPVPARVADMLRRMVSTLTARTFSPN